MLGIIPGRNMAQEHGKSYHCKLEDDQFGVCEPCVEKRMWIEISYLISPPPVSVWQGGSEGSRRILPSIALFSPCAWVVVRTQYLGAKTLVKTLGRAPNLSASQKRERKGLSFGRLTTHARSASFPILGWQFSKYFHAVGDGGRSSMELSGIIASVAVRALIVAIGARTN